MSYSYIINIAEKYLNPITKNRHNLLRFEKEIVCFVNHMNSIIVQKCKKLKQKHAILILTHSYIYREKINKKTLAVNCFKLLDL